MSYDGKNALVLGLGESGLAMALWLARSGARVRELEFDLTTLPVSNRAAKGVTVTKWQVKEVKRTDLALR